MFDDDLPAGKAPKSPVNLETMSIDELEHYIREMEEEIQRVKAEIDKKRAHAQAASSVFKS